MPPFLRGGKVANRSEARKPITGHLCVCSECITRTTWDPLANGSINGQYVSAKVLKEHTRLDNMRRAATTVPTKSTVGSAPELTIPTASPPSSPLRRSIPAVPKRATQTESRRSQAIFLFDSISSDLPRVKNECQFTSGLVFLEPPNEAAIPVTLQPPRTSKDAIEMNCGPFALDHRFPENSAVLAYEMWLLERLLEVKKLGKLKDKELISREEELSHALDEELENIQWHKMSIWEQQRKEIRDRKGELGKVGYACIIDSSKYLINHYATFDPITLTSYIMIATLHLVSGVSIDHCGFQLAGLQLLLSLALSFHGPVMPQSSSIISSIPSDVRTVMNTLNLKPATESYVCCPKCFACYSLDGPDSYPNRCTYRDTPSSPACNRELRKVVVIRGRHRTFPSRRYTYNRMKEWMGRMLCRPGLEELLDRPVYTDNPAKSTDCDPFTHDIWDAGVLRAFLGPDGKQFVTGNGAGGRYIFSLCMDGFNPFQNKEAGKKVSTGAIYMVCLNLPPDIRYKMENMFLVGIIPGPHEPSVHQINHLLRPLVDDLLDFWEPGVRYSKTASHPEGRLIRCVVIPLVCDLPAARQMSGFASYSSTHFCSFCLQKLDDIEDLNYERWEYRTCEEHRKLAYAWRDATSEDERDAIFELHGIRYSELLRLPYWDPTLFLLLDTMHALFLGNLKRHCRDVWGMDVQFEDGDGITYDVRKGKEPTVDEMQEGYDVFRRGSKSKLLGLRVEVLRQICREKGLLFGGKKKKLLKQLLRYRAEMGWFDERGKVTESRSDECEGIAQDAIAQSLVGTVPNSEPLTMSAPDPVSQHDPPPDFDEAMKTLENPTSSRSAITRLKKATLMSLCIAKFGKSKDFGGLTKVKLSDELLAWRAQHVPTKPQTMPPTAEPPSKDPNIDTEGLYGVSAVDFSKAVDIMQAPSTSRNKLQKLYKAALVALCAVKLRGGVASNQNTEELKKLKKTELANKLLAWREVEGLENKSPEQIQRQHAGQAKQSKKTRVLGRNTLVEVWKDIEIMSLPSNVAAAPKAVGSSRHGKLSADQWRTTCTIHLVYTLIRLWGNEPKDSRRYAMLSNFIDLVTATKLAAMRRMSPDRISDFHVHMMRYLENLLILYPGASMTPNQHLSVHLTLLLHRWGPTHAWRCFPFERYNYKLQQVPTNMKIGDIETTMSTRFCQEQNLRAMFVDNVSPDIIRILKPAFDKAFNSDVRGTLLSDIHAFDSPRIENQTWHVADTSGISIEVSSLLSNWLACHPNMCDPTHDPASAFRVLRTQAIHIRDNVYKAVGESPRDSCVVFRKEGMADWFAGQISETFSYGHRKGSTFTPVERFAVIREFKSLSPEHQTMDPYRRFPLVAGRLYYKSFEEALVLIACGDIICPFAQTPHILDQTIACIHALPLDKE